MIDFIGIVDFIPTIKNMKRGSDALKELGYDDNKIRYVLNRSNARTRINVKDVEAILGHQFHSFRRRTRRLPKASAPWWTPMKKTPPRPKSHRRAAGCRDCSRRR